MIGRKLEYLIALAKEGHFTRAAAVCNVSQPTLSAGIQQLEIELGVMIVKRGQRYQGLTEEGEIVLAWAQRSAIDCQRLHQKLRDRSGQLAGALRLGIMASSSPIMSFLTVPFAEQYPKIRLNVVVLSATEIMQGLDEFSLDIGVALLDGKTIRSMRTAKLYDEEFRLLIRRGTRFSGRSAISWKEVRELPLCLFTPESHFLGAQASEFLWAAPQAPQIASNSITLLMAHVRSGHWASVVSRTIAPMIANDGDLEAIPLPKQGEGQSMSIVVPHRDPASPVAETFFEMAGSGAVRENIAQSLAARGTPTHKKELNDPRSTAANPRG